MIMPYHLPPNAYFDDPVDRIEPLVNKEEKADFAALREAINRTLGWAIRPGMTQIGLRVHLIILAISPGQLPCKRPSLSWCARAHGVTRQRAWSIWQDLKHELKDHVRFPQRRSHAHSGAPVNLQSKGKNPTSHNPK